MKLKFESGKFATPSLEDVKKALLTGLKENYEQVNIEVVDCPNLKDWGCPSEGISGNEKMLNIFVPTSPNPTTGFLFMLPEKDTEPLEMSVEEGLKMIISFGMTHPEAGDDTFSIKT